MSMPASATIQSGDMYSRRAGAWERPTTARAEPWPTVLTLAYVCAAASAIMAGNRKISVSLVQRVVRR